MGISTGVTGMRRNADAGQILIAAAGLLAGIGVAWVVSHAGGDRFNGYHLPFAVPVMCSEWGIAGPMRAPRRICVRIQGSNGVPSGRVQCA